MLCAPFLSVATTSAKLMPKRVGIEAENVEPESVAGVPLTVTCTVPLGLFTLPWNERLEPGAMLSIAPSTGLSQPIVGPTPPTSIWTDAVSGCPVVVGGGTVAVSV